MATRNFRKRVRDAIGDPNLQTALGRATQAWADSRAHAFEDIDFEQSRERLRACKEDALSRIPELFEKFKREAELVGVKVYQAAGADDANRIVLDIAKSHGVRKIAKSKSMVSEEIELNRHLIKAGMEVVETDLGEWICQLAGERPSNVTMPAMHKTREQVAELFSKTLGEDIPADIPTLVNVARKQIRRAFLEADMGISGANILIAETGTLVIISNEGNARLVTSLPDVHVALVTYEKLVPSMDEATAILKLLSKSGTGQKMTSYVSFITGPSRTSDIEKTLTLGCHGPREVHVIFVDNGRLELLKDPEFREALYCIKCGACLSVCPVYRTVGGHVFGNMYFGGIGAVLEAFLNGLDESADIADICATCGRCTSFCPSKIDVPRMVLALRRKLTEAHGQPLIQKMILRGLLGVPQRFEKAMKLARVTQSLWQPLKNLPLPGLSGFKTAPPIADKPLHDRLPSVTKAKGTKQGTIAFYAGCAIGHIYPEIGEAVVNRLANLGWEVHLPKNQGCCGIPALVKGDAETACKLAQHNIRIEDFQSVDYIITACPTCLTALKEEFVRLSVPGALKESAERISSKVHDFAEFLINVLHITQADTQERSKVTYHDPCHAIHGHGIAEEPRKLLRLAGYEIVEMANADVCCGFAGSYALSYPDVSGSIAKRKIESIIATGASIVATSCPGCLMQLRAGLKAAGSEIKALHVAEL